MRTTRNIALWHSRTISQDTVFDEELCRRTQQPAGESRSHPPGIVGLLLILLLHNGKPVEAMNRINCSSGWFGFLLYDGEAIVMGGATTTLLLRGVVRWCLWYC